MVVVLKPVSNENWYECTQLKVKPEQSFIGLLNLNMLMILNYALFTRKRF